jgi:hypothetical protein
MAPAATLGHTLQRRRAHLTKWTSAASCVRCVCAGARARRLADRVGSSRIESDRVGSSRIGSKQIERESQRPGRRRFGRQRVSYRADEALPRSSRQRENLGKTTIAPPRGPRRGQASCPSASFRQRMIRGASRARGALHWLSLRILCKDLSRIWRSAYHNGAGLASRQPSPSARNSSRIPGAAAATLQRVTQSRRRLRRPECGRPPCPCSLYTIPTAQMIQAVSRTL